MPHNPTLLKNRNTAIKAAYKALKKRNPKWSWEAIIQDVANDFYLSTATVAKIIREDDATIPCVDTVIKYTKAVQHVASQLALL